MMKIELWHMIVAVFTCIGVVATFYWVGWKRGKNGNDTNDSKKLVKARYCEDKHQDIDDRLDKGDARFDVMSEHILETKLIIIEVTPPEKVRAAREKFRALKGAAG